LPLPIDAVLTLLRDEFNQDDILIKDDTDIESDSDLSDADNHKMPWKPKKKVKYSSNTCFTASLPPAAIFPVPLPPQEVPFDLQPYQGSVPGTDNISACPSYIPSQVQLDESSSVSTPQVQATNVEDPPQVNAEDDDTAAGDVDPCEVPDTMISPSPQPSTPISAPERTPDGGLQHNESSTLVSLTLDDNRQKPSDDITTRYCLAINKA
jgi:hypothetical protein